MKKLSLLFISVSIIAGCSIFGVHFKIHNPHRAGQFPEKTKALVLLGNQDSKFRTCYDVTYYNLGVTFKGLSKKDSIKGEVVIKAVATKDFDTLQIDLFSNLKIKTLLYAYHSPEPKYPETMIEYEPKYIRKENAVFVILSKTLKQTTGFELRIFYSGIPSEAKRPPWKGGFVRKEDNLKKPWWGVACETEGASLWWPCKDVMNDEPDSVDIRLEVPHGLIAVSNGVLIDTTSRHIWDFKKDPDKTTFHWHVSYPINIYNITFYIGNYKLLHDTYYSEITHDTLQLNHYVLEQNYEKAKTHFQQLKKYLAFYEATFGPYPWYRDGFKLVESPYAGMEHQSAIAYGNGYTNDPRYGFDYIILHETAHEWWGNSVTANDLAEGWIHEGFATYAEALYMEKTKGYQAYLDYLSVNKLFLVNRRPVVGEKGIRYFNYRDGDIYNKGSWVLHSLRYAVGSDSLFFDILRSFYMENRMTQISSEKLEELVNRKTGKNFHWFFEQYLYNRFVPELEYCVKNKTFYYRWNPKCSDKSFNVMKITCTGTYHNANKDDPYQGNSYESGLGELTPSTMVKSKPLTGTPEISFNDRNVLFKPIENKNLAKEFERQKKIK